MNYPSNIAVIGCGHWGKNLVRNFAQLGALYSVCDPNKQISSDMAALYNVKIQNFSEILSDSSVKAVVIASPAPIHYELARQALLAGKDVYVEKPITLEREHAEELCFLAQENNAILMVGHLLQYHPAFIALKDKVDAGELGDLLYIYSNRLSFGKVRREENVLWSFAPHDISMILALANHQSPKDVVAYGACQTHDKIEDLVNIQLRFEGGLSAHVSVSWINPFKEQKLVVIGSKGMAVFDDRLTWDQKLTLYPHKIYLNNIDEVPMLNPADPIAFPLSEGEPLKDECEHFLKCIVNRDEPRTNGKEGLMVLNVLKRAETYMKGNERHG